MVQTERLQLMRLMPPPESSSKTSSMGAGYTVAECQVTSVENRQADGAECCTYKQVCRPSSVEPRGGARDRIIVWLESIRLASRACGNYTDIDVQEYVRWRCS